MTRKDIKIGSLLFRSLGLPFPSLSLSLSQEPMLQEERERRGGEGGERIDLERWKGISIVDLKKNALNSSFEFCFFVFFFFFFFVLFLSPLFFSFLSSLSLFSFSLFFSLFSFLSFLFSFSFLKEKTQTDDPNFFNLFYRKDD